MSPFTLERRAAVTSATLWRAITDFASHGRYLPLTRMVLDPGDPHVGWALVGLSGAWPLVLADSMVLTRWEPPATEHAPGRFRLVKTGRLLGGWADVRVWPAGAGGALVQWSEELWPRPAALGRRLAPVTDRVAARMFGHALDGMIADAAHGRT